MRVSVALPIAALAVLPHPRAALAQPVVPPTPGTPIAVEIAAGMSARRVAEGELPALRVAEPVVIGGDTVVRAGAPVWVSRQSARGPRSFGIPATMALSFDSVLAANGAALPLAGSYAVRGDRHLLGTVLAGAASYGALTPLVLGGDAVAVRCQQVVATVPAPVAIAPAPPGPVAAVAAPPCAASEAAIRLAYRKREWIAVAANLVFPGSGHVYAGERRRGLGILATWVPAYVLIMSEFADASPGGLIPNNRTGDRIAVGAVAIWLGGIVFATLDAPRAVRHYNERVLADPAFELPGLSAPTRRRLTASPLVRLVPSGRPEGPPRQVPGLGMSFRVR